MAQNNTHQLSFRFLGPGSGHSPYVVIRAEFFPRVLAEEILFLSSLRLLAKVVGFFFFCISETEGSGFLLIVT